MQQYWGNICKLRLGYKETEHKMMQIHFDYSRGIFKSLTTELGQEPTNKNGCYL